VNESPAIIMWSRTFISIIFPASANCLVISKSSFEGSELPEGWLCINIIAAALSVIATLNTSLENLVG